MFTLALLFALSTKAPVVCVHYTGGPCDYTYSTISQALRDAPLDSMLLIAPPYGIVPLKQAADRASYNRLLQQLRKERQERERPGRHPTLIYPVLPPREITVDGESRPLKSPERF
jgi:hypothetical protein